MMLFFTRSTEHLKNSINLPTAHYTIKQFSDGEIYIKVNLPLAHNNIWIITETGTPGENLLELFFLLNALVRSGAQKINILFTYFGYARQSKPAPDEAASAQVICDIIKMFPLNKVYAIHTHHPIIMHELINFTDVIDTNFFVNIGKNFDVIAAPDKGAGPLAQKIAQIVDKPVVLIHKIRPEQEKVTITSVDGEKVQGEKVLLMDDIVSTGNTLINATQVLHEMGAQKISAAVTHGVFSRESLIKLRANGLENIYVTNTIKQETKNNILVYDIASYIKALLEGDNY